MTPEEAAAAWNELSPEEQQALIDKDPELIGNLDGIDAASRDKANRLSLDRKIDALYQRFGGTDAYETYLEMRRHEEEGNHFQADHARNSLHDLLPDGFSSVEEFYTVVDKYENLSTFRNELNSRSETSLLKYSLDADGLAVDRAIVATGDVDNAKYINTFVPGMNSDVNENFFGYVDANANLRNVAAAEHGIPKNQIATITYLDYEPPTTGELFQDRHDPTARARQGADSLSTFLEGIDASRAYNAEIPEPHMSLMGHSYGSTTAGMAATQVAPDVLDDLTMFGSPGAGAQNITEYNLDSGTAHVSAVPERDAIQGIGGTIASAADFFTFTDDDIKIVSKPGQLLPEIDISGASDYAEEFGINPSHMDGIDTLSNDANLNVEGGEPQKRGALGSLIDSLNPIAEHGAYLPNPNDADKFSWDHPSEGKPNDPRGMVSSPIVSDLARIVVDKGDK